MRARQPQNSFTGNNTRKLYTHIIYYKTCVVVEKKIIITVYPIIIHYYNIIIQCASCLQESLCIIELHWAHIYIIRTSSSTRRVHIIAFILITLIIEIVKPNTYIIIYIIHTTERSNIIILLCMYIRWTLKGYANGSLISDRLLRSCSTRDYIL